MKKKVFSVLCLLVAVGMLTGCNSNSDSKLDSNTDSKSGKITCTKSEKDQSGFETESNMTVNYKDDKVTVVEETSIIKMDNKETLKMTYELSSALIEEFNKIDGIEMSFSKENETTLKSTTKVDFGKLNIDQLKETLGDSFDQSDSFFKNNSYTLEEFKKENLSDYTCK